MNDESAGAMMKSRVEKDGPEPQHQTVLILDFGSQFTQLIARRVRECGVYSEVLSPDTPAADVLARQPIGIILSGGPQSVYEEGAVSVDPEIFHGGVPVLGICYGMHLMAHTLGGTVTPADRREYGRAEIDFEASSCLFDGLEAGQTVWMSHGDHVTELPEGFSPIASTESVPVIGFEAPERKLYSIQFHPEVSHTVAGAEILRNFLERACGATGDWTMQSYLDEAVLAMQEQVGEDRVLCAISGGVDSSVVGALLQRALGEQVTAVFVDNGVLRKGEADQVLAALREQFDLEVVRVDASQRFLDALAGISEPEKKRKIIGGLFIDVFKDFVAELGREVGNVRFLAQGTLYPDVIESQSTKGPSSVIKTHHNVGGLPEELGFELLEPLRQLFKDEVRQLGRELGLAPELVMRHPFPGPGLAVRILGEVTAERVALLQEADAIFISELRDGGFYDQVSQAFVVLLPVQSVGVMGDFRTYENAVALRSVETQDFMTADWSHLPHEFLGRVANRIVNEVRGINRVVYDITSKPPATIEWE